MKLTINQTPPVALGFEEAIQRFEASWSRGEQPELASFLLPQSHGDYRQTLCELIRIDLEFAWKSGAHAVVEDYLEQFSSTVFSKDEIAQFAFEEYRMRLQTGHALGSEEFAKRFSIDVSSWPQPTPSADSTGQIEADRFPKVGSRLHGFDIVGHLGNGAFGRVYLARQDDLAKRFVALKVTQYSDVEPESLAQLQHTNIIPIYSLQRKHGLQSICMPFMGFLTFHDLLRQADSGKDTIHNNGRALISTVANKRASTIAASMIQSVHCPEIDRALVTENVAEQPMTQVEGFSYGQMILWMAKQIAEGLTHAHSRGIVHGDLKPANILISDDGQPLLLDFHLSRSNRGMASSSIAGGTIPYMSAEHLRTFQKGGKPDFSCDLYSLGVIVYEAFSGVLPYPNRGFDDSAINKMIEDRSSAPVRLRIHNTRVPVAVETIVDKLLSPNKSARYSSAEHLHEDLTRHLADLPLRHAPNRSLTERMVKWSRRHPRLSSAGSLLGLTVLLMTIAGVITFNSLKAASLASAENKSREIVEKIQVARIPLTFAPGEDLSTPVQQAAQLVTELRLDSKEALQEHLSKLSPQNRTRQLQELSYLQYWLARARFLVANNVVDASERKQMLELADREIEAAYTLRNDLASPSPRKALLQLQADIAEKLGQMQRASQIRESASLLKYSSLPADRLLQAAELKRLGKNLEALNLLNQLTTEFPTDIFPWLMMGNIHQDLKDAAKADACYSICISLNSRSSWPFFHRGNLRLEGKDYLGAKQDFDMANSITPTATTLLNRALALKGMKKLREAEKDLSLAIEMETSHTRAFFIRYNVRKQLGDTVGAEIDLNEFLTLIPNDEISWNSRGMAQLIKNNPQQALDDFRSALELNPTSTTTLQNIAVIWADYLDDPRESISAFDKIVQLKPDDATAIATRGVYRGRVGQRREAHSDAQAALRISRTADTLYRVAGIFALTSKIEESDKLKSISLLRSAIKLDPMRVALMINQDHDLDAIRDDPKFLELVEILQDIGALKNSIPDSKKQ